MKSVLERAEYVTNQLLKLSIKDIHLISLKIADLNPDTGSFRLKCVINEEQFIEIFQFFFLGELMKYSYALIKNNKCILRYDNSPHHEDLKTFPHHKHLK